jgi:hypothetical protein
MLALQSVGCLGEEKRSIFSLRNDTSRTWRNRPAVDQHVDDIEPKSVNAIAKQLEHVL